MFFRSLLSFLLIGIGIASPWLVRDWLDSRPEHREMGAMVQRVLDRTRDWVGTRLSFPSDEAPDVAETGSIALEPTDETTLLAQRPYPLASTTSRIVEGFAGGKGTPPKPSGPTAEGVDPGSGSEDGTLLSDLGLSRGDPIFIRIFKEEEELEVWMKPSDESDYALFKVYPLSDHAGRPGPKLRSGDGRTPEGFYYVGRTRLEEGRGGSEGFELGFPNALDRIAGRSGGEVLVQGARRSRRSADSFPLAEEDMREVRELADAAIRGGQPFFRVHVFPFRMTDRRMEKEWERQGEWIGFWSNLKEGYDFFENAKFPPSVEVESSRYAFRFP